MVSSPGPPTSPWVWATGDYRNNQITITITFDVTTLALLTGTVTRDAACVYKHLYLGLGSDGTPDTTTHKITPPVGTTSITPAQFAAIGLTTITDVSSVQITAGP